MGKGLQTLQDKIKVKGSISIAMFVVGIIFTALTLVGWCSESKGCMIFFGVLSFVAEAGILLALIAFYIINMNDYKKIDVEALQFFVDNNCSEGPLQASYKMILFSLNKEMKIMIVGLFFVISTLVYQIISNLWTIKHEIFYWCCGIKKPEVDFERDVEKAESETARVAPATSDNV
jgi:hypothetical protein